MSRTGLGLTSNAAGRVFSIGFDERSKGLMAKIRDGLAPQKVIMGIFNLFQRLGGRAAAHVVKKYLSGPTTDKTLSRRTGQLAKAVVGVATLKGGVPMVRLGIFRGPAMKYAYVLEHGGVILPKKARSLAMPVNDALTPAGVDKYGSPRNYPGELKFVPSKKGGKVVGFLYDEAEVKAAKKNWAALRPLWVLLTSVRIEGRHYLQNGMRDYLPVIAKEVLGYLKGAVSGKQ
jgi:hypothetical protein